MQQRRTALPRCRLPEIPRPIKGSAPAVVWYYSRSRPPMGCGGWLLAIRPNLLHGIPFILPTIYLDESEKAE